MKSQLFQDLVLSGGRGRHRGRGFSYSLALHGLALGAVVLLPVLGEERLPLAERKVACFPTVLAAPPPGGGGGGGSAGPRPPAPVRQAETRPAARSVVVSTDLFPPPAPGPPDPPDWDPSCLGEECNGTGGGGGTGDGDGFGPPGPAEAPSARLPRVGIDVEPPAKVHDQAPVDPDLARRVGVQGVVVILCTIAPNGRVANARVLRGHLLLDQAALDAVTQWVYTPTRVNGVPVAVLMTVTINFHFRS